jgi:TonB family protein
VIAANTPSSPKSTVENDAHKTGKAVSEKPSNVQPEKPSPAEKPAATIATLSASGQSRIAQGQDQQQPEIAPTFGVSTGGAAPSLTTLASPVTTSTPSRAVAMQSKLDPLQLVKTVPLVFPVIARQRNITGVVVVQLTVTKEGKIANMQFISGPPVFREAAFDAVSRYQFKPARLNGQLIDQSTQIKLTFK